MIESILQKPKGEHKRNELRKPYRWGVGLLMAISLTCWPPASLQAQTNYQVLQSIQPPPGGSSGQISPLLQGSDGRLYGTTSAGGMSNIGTLFSLGTNGSDYAIICSFNSTNGSIPYGPLLEGADGSLYGTASSGGANGSGTVFAIGKEGNGFHILHDFGSTAGDGRTPLAGLVKGSDGALYGTTASGGSGRVGTVFKLKQDGSSYSVLHAFVGFAGPEGSFPFTKLLSGSDGVLYGTTAYGGANGLGVLFKVHTDGSGYTVLHSFMGPDGRPPLAELIEGNDGMLYGTTYYGGTNDFGTVFVMNKDGTAYRVIYNFTGDGEGSEPFAGLVQGAQGTLFGTTRYGGTDDLGTAFRLNADGSGYTVLHSFTSTNGDGAEPGAALLVASDGALYGTTLLGGTSGEGTVFKLFCNIGTSPLVIQILGDNPLTNECHSPFVDPGATVLEDGSGLATFSTNSTVNPNSPGLYSIQYIATDLDGNAATNTRAVIVQQSTPPVILSQTILDGRFQLSFSGPDNQSYSILATTNLLLPLANWTVLTNGTFTGPATFMDTATADHPARFYKVRSP